MGVLSNPYVVGLLSGVAGAAQGYIQQRGQMRQEALGFMREQQAIGREEQRFETTETRRRKENRLASLRNQLNTAKTQEDCQAVIEAAEREAAAPENQDMAADFQMIASDARAQKGRLPSSEEVVGQRNLGQRIGEYQLTEAELAVRVRQKELETMGLKFPGGGEGPIDQETRRLLGAQAEVLLSFGMNKEAASLWKVINPRAAKALEDLPALPQEVVQDGDAFDKMYKATALGQNLFPNDPDRAISWANKFYNDYGKRPSATTGIPETSPAGVPPLETPSSLLSGAWDENEVQELLAIMWQQQTDNPNVSTAQYSTASINEAKRRFRAKQMPKGTSRLLSMPAQISLPQSQSAPAEGTGTTLPFLNR